MIKKILIYLANRLNLNVKYGDNFFKEDWFENWENLKEVLEQLIKTQEDWKAILDFGCGPGIMIPFMNEKGFEYIGCDYSNDAKKLYLERFKGDESLYVDSIESLKDKSFDVFLSFDVFEHMTNKEISTLLKQLPKVTHLFVNISRSKFIPGHVNLKSDEQWISFFKQNDYKFNNERTNTIRDKYLSIKPNGEDLWHKNIFVFSKVNEE
jgi:SAM-dependent methyltransferase